MKRFLGVWNHILGVWTYIYVSGLISWVSGLILWVDRQAGGRPGRVSETFGGQIHFGNMYPEKHNIAYIIEC